MANRWPLLKKAVSFPLAGVADRMRQGYAKPISRPLSDTLAAGYFCKSYPLARIFAGEEVRTSGGIRCQGLTQTFSSCSTLATAP
jgi:hypothetical protein